MTEQVEYRGDFAEVTGIRALSTGAIDATLAALTNEKARRAQPATLDLPVSRYAVADGALTEVPAWESHARGKNWLAVIRADPKAPNGLDRRFMDRAHGAYYYMVAGLKPGDTVEFGADYYSGGGNPRRTRVYGVVVAVTDNELQLSVTKTAPAALALAKSFPPA